VACQNKECRLKSILGIMLVVQYAPANVEYHRAMALHEHGESLLVFRGSKAPQQLAVRELFPCARVQDALHLLEHNARMPSGHIVVLPGDLLASLLLKPASDRSDPFSHENLRGAQRL
jgi:hypothetical protein